MNRNQEVNNNAWGKSESTVSLESSDGWMVGDRCQWTNDGKTHGATVRWIGKLRGHAGIYAGLDFDEPIGQGTGVYQGCDLYVTRRNHAGFVTLSTLLRVDDFHSNITEDYYNKLNIVNFAANYRILSSITVSDEHPWRSKNLYQSRDPPPNHSSLTPNTECAPFAYVRENQLARFADSNPERLVKWHETIRLCDVEAFRKSTAEMAQAKVNCDRMSGLRADLTALSITSSSHIRPVIYRYINAIKNSFALLEAIHFELFMPDRPDLRFLALRFPSVPAGTLEGEYFRVSNVELLSQPSFAIDLEKVYPIVWEVKRVNKIDFESQNDEEGLAYIVKKKAEYGGETAVSDISEGDLFIREKLFPNEDLRREHSLMGVTLKKMITAQLYPVEPPLPTPLPTVEEQNATIKGLSRVELTTVYRAFVNGKIEPKAPSNINMIEFLGRFVNDERLLKELRKLESRKKREKYALKAFVEGYSSGEEEEEEEPGVDRRSEYLKLVYGVQSSSERTGCVVTAVRELSAGEETRIEDRLGEFTTYGEAGDLRLMEQLLRLGCQYRVSFRDESDSEDDEEDKKEDIVLKTIKDELRCLSGCRPLLDCIYGRSGSDGDAAGAMDKSGAELLSIPFRDETSWNMLQLNEAQSHAVRLHADASGPRVFCVLAPPGSGKTLVAAAMTAEVARLITAERRERRGRKSEQLETYDHYSSVQLLLSVQNVAVDNMGAALKNMDYGGGQIYNMKSVKRLDPKFPEPFDFFDLMPEKELRRWQDNKVHVSKEMRTYLRQKIKKLAKRYKWNYHMKMRKELEEMIHHHKQHFEQQLFPKVILSTVEMLLRKMCINSKLLAEFKKVKQIIIDEASLLTEAALFAIIRRFPEARIVLIGDDKQLPPFMYDGQTLGHELAGRPALTVAMKTGRVPVVELNEVYRAPPSIVAPYNRLSYEGRLVSKKAEGQWPLSDIGLIHSGRPQLLLIDVIGNEDRNTMNYSLYNTKELEAAVRLLKKFPHQSTKHIMIICLYKEQKFRLEEMLDKEFNSARQYTVLTVDSAQGKEAPIVILMTTRTQRGKGFFWSTERCNVAVSRQQEALIILGKGHLLRTNAPWSTVVNVNDFLCIEAASIC